MKITESNAPGESIDYCKKVDEMFTVITSNNRNDIYAAFESLEIDIQINLIGEIEKVESNDVDIENKKNYKILREVIINNLLKANNDGLLEVLVQDLFPGAEIDYKDRTCDCDRNVLIIQGVRVYLEYGNIKASNIKKAYNLKNEKESTIGKVDDILSKEELAEKIILESRQGVEIVQESKGMLTNTEIDLSDPYVLNALHDYRKKLSGLSSYIGSKFITLSRSDIDILTESRGWKLAKKSHDVQIIDNEGNIVKLYRNGKSCKSFNHILSTDKDTIATKIGNKVELGYVNSEKDYNTMIWKDGTDSINRGMCEYANTLFKKGFSGKLEYLGEGIYCLDFDIGEYRFFDINGNVLRSEDSLEILSTRELGMNIEKAREFLGLTEETGK